MSKESLEGRSFEFVQSKRSFIETSCARSLQDADEIFHIQSADEFLTSV